MWSGQRQVQHPWGPFSRVLVIEQYVTPHVILSAASHRPHKQESYPSELLELHTPALLLRGNHERALHAACAAHATCLGHAAVAI